MLSPCFFEFPSSLCSVFLFSFPSLSLLLLPLHFVQSYHQRDSDVTLPANEVEVKDLVTVFGCKGAIIRIPKKCKSVLISKLARMSERFDINVNTRTNSSERPRERSLVVEVRAE